MTHRPSKRSAPCLAADRTAKNCIVGLLLGVACCPDTTCGLCRATVVSAQRWDGVTAERAHRSLRRTRGTLTRCPTCGFPAPPPMPVVAAAPPPPMPVAPKRLTRLEQLRLEKEQAGKK